MAVKFILIMRKIPKDVLEEYLSTSFSKECCFCGNKIPQLHHNLIYGGRQVNEVWTFLPLCKKCHDSVNHINVRRLADWCMLNRGTDEELQKYSKVMDYKAKRKWLNILFGEYSPRKLKEHYANNYHHHKTNIH